MVAYVKYETAIEKLANKLIDMFGTGGAADTWNVVVHTDAPVPATDSTLANITQITGTNGYTTDGSSVTFNATRSGGTVNAAGTDVVWTANPSPWPAAQYVSMADITASNALWCSWDYGSSFTVAAGETLTVDFATNIFTLA